MTCWRLLPKDRPGPNFYGERGWKGRQFSSQIKFITINDTSAWYAAHRYDINMFRHLKVFYDNGFFKPVIML
ncbi:hypothetical protein D8B25_04545 [Verminephrobacter aporrectodeae subsp. tuberculatae]|nr:hypothetical protein [Verminephrobacter aporrectodeae subsp. tuberculatae]MCW8201256.1 hypothetical protein [Verminephrobacter aporrectodeae subsp. tuberculatae]